MRTLLSLLLMTLGFVAQAATPTLTNFFPHHFIITPNAPAPTNVIKLRLNPVQFDTNAGTVTIKGSFTNQGGLYIFNTTNIFQGDTIINTNTVIYNILTTNFFDLSHIVYSNTVIQYYSTTNIFETNTTIIIESNVTVIVNGTNTDLTQLWTNSAGAYLPTTPQNTMSVTGLTSSVMLQANGAFQIETGTNITVLAGENDLNPYNLGSIYISSTEANPTNAQVRLSTGNGNGTFLFLRNMLDGSGFELLNGDELWDGPANHLYLSGGNWYPTNAGDTMFLLGSPKGWTEVERWKENTNIVTIPTFLGDAVWTNDAGRIRLVVTNAASVVEVQGNDNAGHGSVELWAGGIKRWTMLDGVFFPEANYDIGTSLNPVQTLWMDGLTGIKMSALRICENSGSPESSVLAPVGSLYLQNDGGPGTTLWTKTNGAGNTGWSAVGGGTTINLWTNSAGMLQPMDLTLQPLINQGLFVGTNSPSHWSHTRLTNGEALISYHTTDSGEPNNSQIYLETRKDTAGLINSHLNFTVQTNGGTMQLTRHLGYDSKLSMSVGDPSTTSNYHRLLFQDAGTNLFVVQPAATGGVQVAYTLNTARPLAEADTIMQVQNLGTNVLSVGGGGQVIFGPGRTNVLARTNGTDLAYFNGATETRFRVFNGSGATASLGLNAGGNGVLNSSSGFLYVTPILETASIAPLTDNASYLGGQGSGTYWQNLGTYQEEIMGWQSGTNYSKAVVAYDNTTNGTILISSTVNGAPAGAARPFKIDRNLGVPLAVGAVDYVDMFEPSATNAIGGTMTFLYATNGMDLVQWTHVRMLLNGSGSDQTVNLPAGWHKGLGSGSSITITNGTYAKLFVTANGPTSSLGLQTNVECTVSYFP